MGPQSVGQRFTQPNDAVSMDGHFSVSGYFDVVGSLAKTVKDVAIFLVDKENLSKLSCRGGLSKLACQGV